MSIAEDVSTVGAFEHELEQLERAASEDRQKRWREMGRDAQVRWLSLLVAWTKALDADAMRLQERTPRLATIFRTLRSFSINDILLRQPTFRGVRRLGDHFPSYRLSDAL